jgi:hypothetical protein
MPIKPEHLDELLSGYEKPEDLLGEEGLFKQLKKALLERALGAELTHHIAVPRDGHHVGHVAEGAGAIRHIELPARDIRHIARIPQPVATLDQRCAAMSLAKRPILMEPADMPDLPEHGIDDVEARAQQFRP